MSMIRAVMNTFRFRDNRSTRQADSTVTYVPARRGRREDSTDNMLVSQLLAIGDPTLNEAVLSDKRREMYCRLHHIASSTPDVIRLGTKFCMEQVELARSILRMKPFEDVVLELMRERLAGSPQSSY